MDEASDEAPEVQGIEPDDEVVARIPIVPMSTPIGSNRLELALLQMPVRPRFRPLGLAPPSLRAARFKPQSGLLQLDFDPRELGQATADSHGSIAPSSSRIRSRAVKVEKRVHDDDFMNLDMDSDDNSPEVKIEDEKNFNSSSIARLEGIEVESNRYAVGLLRDGVLYVSPLRHAFRLHYVPESKSPTTPAAPSAAPAQPTGLPLLLRQHESERAREARLRSWVHLKQIRDEEPWIDLDPRPVSEGLDALSDALEEALQYPVESGTPASVENYLTALSISPPGARLVERVRRIVVDASCLRFCDVIRVLKPQSSFESDAALSVLREVGVLIRGVWVVKSKVAVPPLSEYLQAVRNYLLLLLALDTTPIQPLQITASTGLALEHVLALISPITRKTAEGRVLKYDPDEDFIASQQQLVKVYQQSWVVGKNRIIQAVTDARRPASSASTPTPAPINRGVKRPREGEVQPTPGASSDAPTPSQPAPTPAPTPVQPASAPSPIATPPSVTQPEPAAPARAAAGRGTRASVKTEPPPTGTRTNAITIDIDEDKPDVPAPPAKRGRRR